GCLESLDAHNCRHHESDLSCGHCCHTSLRARSQLRNRHASSFQAPPQVIQSALVPHDGYLGAKLFDLPCEQLNIVSGDQSMDTKPVRPSANDIQCVGTDGTCRAEQREPSHLPLIITLAAPNFTPASSPEPWLNYPKRGAGEVCFRGL